MVCSRAIEYEMTEIFVPDILIIFFFQLECRWPYVVWCLGAGAYTDQSGKDKGTGERTTIPFISFKQINYLEMKLKVIYKGKGDG